MRIVWTAPALRDLEAARAYITLDRPSAAEKQAESIITAVAGLRHFPETGRAGRRDGTRELVVGRTPYLVPYRIRGETIEILRVLHGRQKWPDTL
jgi:toxin ParE1/3/4